MVLVLNMMDDAKRRGIKIDTLKLAQHLGIKVIETVAVKRHGLDKLLSVLDEQVPNVAHA
jgi:ferrous iron transport protein B